MFTDIERKYQKELLEKRFWEFYAWRAVPVVVGTIMLVLVLGVNVLVVAILGAVILLGCAVWFFVSDMRMMISGKMPRGWKAKKEAYEKVNEEMRIEGLISDLCAHNLETKDDILLALEYFERRRPMTTKTGLLEWVLSIAIALASIIALAYDETNSVIDEMKLVRIVWPTLRIISVFALPTLLIGGVAKKIFFSRARIDSILVEDLAYIYVNYPDSFKE